MDIVLKRKEVRSSAIEAVAGLGGTASMSDKLGMHPGTPLISAERNRSGHQSLRKE